MDLIAVLQKVGMTSEEANIYLTLLESGESSLNDIAQRFRLDITDLCTLLEKMKMKGWVSEFYQDNHKSYASVNPTLLIKNFEKDIKKLQTYLPEMLGRYVVDSRKTRVEVFNGIEGIKHVYNDTLLHQDYELFAYLRSPIDNNELHDFLIDHVQKRIQKNIKAYVIATNRDLHYKDKDDISLRETIIINQSWFELDIEIQIYQNKVSICSFEDEYIGIIIHSPAIYKSLKNIFHLLWTHLKT